MSNGDPSVIGIVVSEADPASVTIGEQLLSLAEWESRQATDDVITARFDHAHFEVCYFAEMHLQLESVADYFSDPSLIVFVSRHAGETGPVLTAHFPGNVGDAEYGGSAYTVPPAAPVALSNIIQSFCHYAPDEFDVTLECTHHGPTDVGAPCLFAEVGSGMAEWSDPRPAKAVAQAVLDLEPREHWSSQRTVIGLGGSHYAPRFDRIVRETDWSVGHIGADWSLKQLSGHEQTAAVIESLLEQSNASRILLDGSDKLIADVSLEIEHAIVSETWLRETTGVDLDLVENIEELVGTIDSGTRIGNITDVSPRTITVDKLHPEFLREILRANADKSIDLVAANTVAYRTTENGNRLTGTIATTGQSAREHLIESLFPLVENRYKSLSREGDELVVVEAVFDPERARACGVPEGPKFGRLANGEPVDIDGTEIRPSDVINTVERRFPIWES